MRQVESNSRSNLGLIYAEMSALGSIVAVNLYSLNK